MSAQNQQSGESSSANVTAGGTAVIAATGSGDVQVSSTVRSQLQKDSPLQLLNGVPLEEGAIKDPAALAAKILKEQTEKREATPVSSPIKVTQPTSSSKENHAANLLTSLNKNTAEPVAVTDKAVPQSEDVKLIPGDKEGLKELDRALSGEEAPPVEVAPPETDVPDPLADIPEELPETEEATDGKPTAAQNFTKLRTRTKAVVAELEAKKTELQTVKETLQKYQTGEAIPEILQQKEEEIARLSSVKELVDLKTSPEAHRKFVAPLNDLGAQLDNYATTYEIPPSVLQTSLEIENPAELSRFLSDHFDPAAALEVKQIVTKMQGIRKEFNEAQKKPGQALQALQEEHRALAEVKENQRREGISNTARGAWAEAVATIQEEGDALELVWHPDNSDHNQKIVQPIRAAAAKGFGKIMKELAEQGLKELNPQFAKDLARTVLLAYASGVAIESRNATVAYAESVQKNAADVHRLLRPPVGGYGNGSGTVEPKKDVNKPAPTPAKEGAKLLGDLGLIPKQSIAQFQILL